MAYIPENHKKYNLLPMCRQRGGEVFSYPGKIMAELERFLPEGENMIPYGYDSFEQYIDEMNDLASLYFQEEKSRIIYEEFIKSMHEMNNKDDWSVLRYLGESDNNLFGLTHGNIYYWPCEKDDPHYEGVIDDEEFTSYWYPTEADDWEILEDPTEMARSTLYGKSREKVTRKQYEDVMNQVGKMMRE